MNFIISVTTAILIWSLYPLAVSVGLNSMDSIEFILIIYVIASIGATIVGIAYLWKKKLFNKAFNIQMSLEKRAYTLIIASGIVGVLCHGFFIIALTLANKAGVSLLYESWPVLAIIASPFLMKKQWNEVSLKEFGVGIFAMVGVAFIIFSDQDLGAPIGETKVLSETSNYTTIGGYILAFAGAYMLALVIIIKGAYSEYFKDLKDDFGATLISEMLSRIVCVIVILTIYIFMDIRISESNIHWGASIFVGFIVFVGGGALYTYALLLSKSPTFHVLNFFVPVLAVLWLWLAGETDVNAGLFIGGAIVTVCNIYLVYAGRKAKPSIAS